MATRRSSNLGSFILSLPWCCFRIIRAARLTVGFFAIFIGFEFQPCPVCDLVCKDCEDEDLADRTGKGFVKLGLDSIQRAHT